MGLEEGPHGDIYSFLEPDENPSNEDLAVEAAKRGKTAELAALIESEASNLENDPEHRVGVSPATLRLVAEFLSGKLNLKTGKEKGVRGRPKMGKSERAQKTPTHDAANYYVPAVKSVLREE